MPQSMCGIIGKIAPATGGAVGRDVLERMCVALQHRGPDSRGLFADGEAGLGIQRLRVVDLVTGDQPIYNEDGSVVVVLNGEIYNFADLRSRLMASGHRFSTQGDTEVMVHLYEEHGLDCVRHLHGMFAFALWDRRRHRLLLARDRIGKKPLFYAALGGGLTFASELRALMEDRDVPGNVDAGAVDAFLRYGYVPAPRSIFRDVQKLPPAHTLVFEDGRMSLQRYWQLDFSRKLSVRDPRDLHEPILHAIRQATRRRMVADVSVGAFLSGGIDSSAVVAAMAEASTAPVKTFSIGFDRDAFDELPHARAVARQFGTEHQEFTVSPDAIAIVPKIVRHYGEPYADPSAIPSFYLAEMTRRHVTVALNGDGGDEAFGGYQRYVANGLASRLEHLPMTLRRAAASAAGHLDDGDVSSVASKARRLMQGLPLDPSDRYRRYVSWFDGDQRANLYTEEFAELTSLAAGADPIAEAWREASGDHVVDIMLEVDSATYLPGDLITKVDIATMAYGLEARSPLLDHELMEFAASIPAELKVRGGQKKWILREALREWLPSDLLDRPKQGFSVPVGDWFRHELRDLAREVLLDSHSLARGYFRPQAVRSMLDRHAAGSDAEGKRLWALFMLELWHHEFADRSSVPFQLEATA
jgi:asparagine synthase (glutamine-hydrolysing)